MNRNADEIVSADEKDILQEIMNIAFGNAAADLAEVIDIHVKLHVPEIHIISIKALPAYLINNINVDKKSSIVEQKFWGHFEGSGLLVFPRGSGRELLALIEEKDTSTVNELPLQLIEKGGLLEIGNILIGACVGKFSELLGTFATYSPPQVFQGNSRESDSFIDSFNPSHTAIIMKTIFDFKEKDLSGFLLILTNYESIAWLRKALHTFLESYE